MCFGCSGPSSWPVSRAWHASSTISPTYTYKN
jgi:hypothetical protein